MQEESPSPLPSPRPRDPSRAGQGGKSSGGLSRPRQAGHRSQGGDSALEATCCVGAATFRVTTSHEDRETEQN